MSPRDERTADVRGTCRPRVFSVASPKFLSSIPLSVRSSPSLQPYKFNLETVTSTRPFLRNRILCTYEGLPAPPNKA